MLSVHKDLTAALRIFRCGVAPSDEFLSAGREELEVGEVAIQDREFGDVGRIELNVDVGAVGIKLRDFPSDFDALRDCANLQRCVDVSRRVGGDDYTRYVKRLEAGGFDVNLVVIRDKVRDRIVAALVR